MATKPSSKIPGSGPRKDSTSESKGKVPNDEKNRKSSAGFKVPFIRSVVSQPKVVKKRKFPFSISSNVSEPSTSKPAVKEKTNTPSSSVASKPNLTLRVCLLDDSYESSQEIQTVLERDGHKVDHYFSAEDAYKVLFKKEYDVFISTQTMGVDVPVAMTENLIRILKSSEKIEIMQLSIVAVTRDISEKM